MATMHQRSQDARHICRHCGYMIDPQPGAHGKMRVHYKQAHGWKVATVCLVGCGMRAIPFEGRYTAEYRPTDRTLGRQS